MDAEQMQGIVEKLLGEYGWLILSGILLLTFKQAIQKVVNSFFVFYGNDYNEDDIVEISGQLARIIRVGLFKTTFFIYKIGDSGEILKVNKLTVDNDRLKIMQLMKPLQGIDLVSLGCHKDKK